MDPVLVESLASLRLMPDALESSLRGRPDHWLDLSHGEGMLTPREVVGHFVQGVREDWIPRARIILSEGDTRAFTPFDPYAYREYSHSTPLGEMLGEFRRLRLANVDEMESLLADPVVLELRGLHPRLGPVTMRQLVHTWAAHDLYHLGQIYKSFSMPFLERIGPWQDSLNIPQFN